MGTETQKNIRPYALNESMGEYSSYNRPVVKEHFQKKGKSFNPMEELRLLRKAYESGQIDSSKLYSELQDLWEIYEEYDDSFCQEHSNLELMADESL